MISLLHKVFILQLFEISYQSKACCLRDSPRDSKSLVPQIKSHPNSCQYPFINYLGSTKKQFVSRKNTQHSLGMAFGNIRTYQRTLGGNSALIRMDSTLRRHITLADGRTSNQSAKLNKISMLIFNVYRYVLDQFSFFQLRGFFADFLKFYPNFQNTCHFTRIYADFTSSSLMQCAFMIVQLNEYETDLFFSSKFPMCNNVDSRVS